MLLCTKSFCSESSRKKYTVIYSNFEESKMTSSHLILTMSVLIIFESKFVAATKILNIAEFRSSRNKIPERTRVFPSFTLHGLKLTKLSLGCLPWVVLIIYYSYLELQLHWFVWCDFMDFLWYLFFSYRFLLFVFWKMNRDKNDQWWKRYIH